MLQLTQSGRDRTQLSSTTLFPSGPAQTRRDRPPGRGLVGGNCFTDFASLTANLFQKHPPQTHSEVMLTRQLGILWPA